MISIGNFEEMKQKLTDYAATYKDIVITEQTFKDDKKVRSQMRALKKQINDRRIAIKKDINKPLDEFESNVKELTTILDNVIDPIDKGIKFYDQAVKDKKKQHVMQLVADLTDQNGLTVDDIQFNNKWLNTTSNDKNVIKEVKAQIAAIKAEQARIDGERLIITNYAKAVELDAQGWLAMVNDGKSAAEVMKLMDKARDEAKRKAAAKAEYDAAMAKLDEDKAKENTVEVEGRKVDPDTGEIIKPVSQEQPEVQRSYSAKPKTYNVLLKLNNITGPQSQMLKDFLDDNGVDYDVKGA
ncbi:putative replication protein [Latilactobacillus phage TMW 1.2272 P1]|nr:putative replication protein [Latilactobacillus phage TMW 1.2272 P1]